MVDFSEKNDEELQSLGQMLLDEINISLFNAEPTLQKAYYIYFELSSLGYKEKDKELACKKIKDYFKNRTVENQYKEFRRIFGLSFKIEMRQFMTLSYRTSEISSRKVLEVARKINHILTRLEFYKYGIDEDILTLAIAELYNPKYHENEWFITIPAMLSKVKKHLLLKNRGQFLDTVDDAFYLMDPNPKKKKRIVQRSHHTDSNEINYEDGSSDVKEFRRLDYQQEKNLSISGPNAEFDQTICSRKNIIKDSELNLVKANLELLKSSEIPEALNVEIFQNDGRHPLINKFINCAKTYNRVVSDENMHIKEALKEMKFVIRALRETGEEIVSAYEEQVGEKARDLSNAIKAA